MESRSLSRCRGCLCLKTLRRGFFFSFHFPSFLYSFISLIPLFLSPSSLPHFLFSLSLSLSLFQSVLTALELGGICQKVGVPAGVINICPGAGETVCLYIYIHTHIHTHTHTHTHTYIYIYA